MPEGSALPGVRTNAGAGEVDHSRLRQRGQATAAHARTGSLRPRACRVLREVLDVFGPLHLHPERAGAAVREVAAQQGGV